MKILKEFIKILNPTGLGKKTQLIPSPWSRESVSLSPITIISKNFATQEYIKNKIKVNGKEYVLYIFKLAYNSDGFVVCVEDFPSLLTNYELLGLATNVALLKVNLLHE